MKREGGIELEEDWVGKIRKAPRTDGQTHTRSQVTRAHKAEIEEEKERWARQTARRTKHDKDIQQQQQENN